MFIISAIVFAVKAAACASCGIATIKDKIKNSFSKFASSFFINIFILIAKRTEIVIQVFKVGIRCLEIKFCVKF